MNRSHEGTQQRNTSASEDLMINAAALVKLPPFWKDNYMIAQVEAVFAISRITADETKFKYVVLNLDTTALPLVSDILTNLSEQGKYEALKTRLISSLDETTESKLWKLLRGNEAGNEKPSAFLQRLRNLSGGQCNDNVLRTLFMEQLSKNIRTVLAISKEADLSKLTYQIDKIVDIVKPNMATLNLIDQSQTSTTETASLIDALATIVRAPAEKIDQFRFEGRTQSRPQLPCFRGRSRSRKGIATAREYCYYCAKFEHRAIHCKQPSSWKKGN